VPAANASSAPAPSTAAVAAPVVPSSATPTRHLGNPAQLRRYVDALEWLYIDEAGRTQGPFKAVQMADWTEHGYFTDDTRLHALGGLMPEGTERKRAVCPLIDPGHRLRFYAHRHFPPARRDLSRPG